ncbi:hypothetical protein ACR78G_20270 [Sphingobacterium spiritivorum]|uniref:hypothetical protein n=1 Tax=Sphingobacterium spiritivorum TaxID=258 RepID=UPI003DA40E06
MKLRKKHPRILLWLSMFAIACETDPLNEQNQSSDSTELKLENLSFSDLSKNNAVLQKLTDLQSEEIGRLQARTVNVKDYGYNVDTESSIRISKGEFHTITFRIISKPGSSSIENLILVSDGKEYTAYIAEYLLADKEREMLASGIQPKNLLPTKLLEIKTQSKFNIGGNGSNCVRVAIITKNYCDDKNGNRITDKGDNDGRCVSNWTKEEYTVLFINKDCLSSGGIGHGPTTGNGNTGGVSIGPGSGGGGDGSPGREDTGTGSITEGGNNLITTPILLPDRNNIRNHINELNKITNRTEVKEKLVELQRAVRTIQMELGVEFFTDDEADDEAAPYLVEDLEPGYSGVQFGPVRENSILRMHDHHYPGLEPVFSAKDVIETARFFKGKRQLGAYDAENITIILVSELGIFALRVTEPVKAKTFADALNNGNVVHNFNLKYDTDVREKAANECNCTFPSIEYDKLLSDYLIDFLNEHKTGLTLFSATVDADGNYSWAIHSKYNQ